MNSVEKTRIIRFEYVEVMFWGVSRNLGDRVLQIRGGFEADTVELRCDSVQCQRTTLLQVWLPKVTGPGASLLNSHWHSKAVPLNGTTHMLAEVHGARIDR